MAIEMNDVELASLDLQSFAKAWVAQLIERGITGVKPHEAGHRRGFDRVIEYLDTSVDQLITAGHKKSVVLPLLQIANELRPSAAGDYEGFESALRSLQLTFTSSPNPWYEYVAFPVSKKHAESFVEDLTPTIRELSAQAAAAFQGGGVESNVGGAPS